MNIRHFLQDKHVDIIDIFLFFLKLNHRFQMLVFHEKPPNLIHKYSETEQANKNLKLRNRIGRGFAAALYLYSIPKLSFWFSLKEKKFILERVRERERMRVCLALPWLRFEFWQRYIKPDARVGLLSRCGLLVLFIYLFKTKSVLIIKSKKNSTSSHFSLSLINSF